MDLNFSLDDINKAADTFLRHTHTYRVIAFHGEMGAGKTTFIHALCNVLGVLDNVSSPTFSIINEYEGSNKQIIYHLDLYRLKDEEEAYLSGVTECLDSGNYCFVEWPEKAPGILPHHTLHIYLTALNNDTRKLLIKL